MIRIRGTYIRSKRVVGGSAWHLPGTTIQDTHTPAVGIDPRSLAYNVHSRWQSSFCVSKMCAKGAKKCRFRSPFPADKAQTLNFYNVPGFLTDRLVILVGALKCTKKCIFCALRVAQKCQKRPKMVVKWHPDYPRLAISHFKQHTISHLGGRARQMPGRFTNRHF